MRPREGCVYNPSPRLRRLMVPERVPRTMAFQAALEAPSPSSLARAAGISLLFRALASPRRLELLDHLRHPRTLEEAAGLIGVARTAARRHLELLTAAGILKSEPGPGMVRHYFLSPSLSADLQESFDLLSSGLQAGGHDGSGGRAAEVLQTRPWPGPDLATSAPRPRLACVHGPEAGRLIPLARPVPRGGWTIGRSPRCRIRLTRDPHVSWQHAVVQAEGEGVSVLDLFSTNGTRLNERTLRGERSRLVSGDILVLGRTVLVFQGLDGRSQERHGSGPGGDQGSPARGASR